MKFIRSAYGSILSLLAAPITSFALEFDGGGQNLPPVYTPTNFSGTYLGGNSYAPAGAGQNLPPLNTGAGTFGGRGISRVQGSGAGFTGIINVVYTLIGYFQVIIFLTALVYLLRAAFLFTQGKEKEASPMILNAVIGIVVALLAFAVIPFICSITGAGGEACGVGR